MFIAIPPLLSVQAYSYIHSQRSARDSNIHLSALELLVWERTTSTFLRCASFTAQRTMLWLTVLVNKTTKSGEPILDLKSLGTCVKTFALYEYFLHIFLYWQTMQSLPPTMTTLIYIAPLRAP
jgi:hypothetical protein